MWQGQDHAARGCEVRNHIPREARLLDRRAAHRDLCASAARLRPVQVEENESRPVAAPDVVDDLILRHLAI